MEGGPSMTAAVVAAVRARLARPVSTTGTGDAAAALAADFGTRFPYQMSRTLVGYLTGRTRFFDDIVSQAATAGTGTVVLVGAGYDDRSLRFRTPGVRFVEVDHPSTQADKRSRLRRLDIDVSDVQFVPLDLERESLDELDVTAPVTFVCEAVLPYLSPDRAEAVLTSMARHRGTLAADLPVHPAGLVGRIALAALRVSTAAVGEPVRFIVEDEAALAALLDRCGWTELRRATGRDLRMPAAARDQLFLVLGAAQPR